MAGQFIEGCAEPQRESPACRFRNFVQQLEQGLFEEQPAGGIADEQFAEAGQPVPAEMVCTRLRRGRPWPCSVRKIAFLEEAQGLRGERQTDRGEPRPGGRAEGVGVRRADEDDVTFVPVNAPATRLRPT